MGVTQVFDVFGKIAEKEYVLFADLASYFDLKELETSHIFCTQK
jgi:hypothetical protein